MAGVELLAVRRPQVDGVEHHLHRVGGHQRRGLRVHRVVRDDLDLGLLLERALLGGGHGEDLQGAGGHHQGVMSA